MPNYCENRLIVRGSTKDLIKFIQQYDYCDLNKIIPEPLTIEECPKQYRLAEDKERPWFNWYDWHVAFWGTKWNTFDLQGPTIEEIEESECTEIEIWFGTAWSPCENPIKKLIMDNPHLEFNYYYYEPGAGFGGGFEHGMWFECNGDLRDFSIKYEFESPEYWDELDAEYAKENKEEK